MPTTTTSHFHGDCKKLFPKVSKYVSFEYKENLTIVNLLEDFLSVFQDVDALTNIVEIINLIDKSSESKAVLFSISEKSFSPSKAKALWSQIPDEYIAQESFVIREEYAFRKLIKQIISISSPTIFSMQGEVDIIVLSLALACDYRIADASTSFHNTCKDMDIPIAEGVIYFLLKFIGIARTKRILMQKKPITIDLLEAWDIIDKTLISKEYKKHLETVSLSFTELPTKYFKFIKNGVNNSFSTIDAFFEKEGKDFFRNLECKN